MINLDADPNCKAESKIRYAIGLRNSFGQCWYLTKYSCFSVFGNCDQYLSLTHHYSIDRECFNNDDFAQMAYVKVDSLMEDAISEFTDSERAAQAQLEMMNYATLMKQYSETKVVAQIRGRCDNYYDYALQKL